MQIIATIRQGSESVRVEVSLRGVNVPVWSCIDPLVGHKLHLHNRRRGSWSWAARLRDGGTRGHSDAAAVERRSGSLKESDYGRFGERGPPAN
ncbi:hypothetical protein CC78DRAFT_171433 [Lojkania enalia]|uniref:Uncharacterized protein n=1 Tax=Lojkania enalia TaxID=147567 RepID=A0A9P4JWQ5_9PLEO|nr:hypothetical protein CC78DRAFT_171433 [Didymosphaeria enalia]